MKLSVYVAKLQALLAEHGDLDVCHRGADGFRRVARTPELAHERKDSKFPHFYNPSVEEDSKKGMPVIRV